MNPVDQAFLKFALKTKQDSLKYITENRERTEAEIKQLEKLIKECEDEPEGVFKG